ncbi:C2 domain-containing protein At1g53590-like isoform X1 [Typha angustifolia]|uniref:C2 domain-containing protein At1g53590-like isoform X1 n=1 Tax=Typha angustifolia TaxID=59011 RepID=UPI003C2D49E3
MEVSVIHHIVVVLAVLWIAAWLGWSHPLLFFIAFLHLYEVNEKYSVRLRSRIQYEERKCANQQRVLSDTESVRWLNHAAEKIWPICMENIISQHFLLPITPWFLDKFKPWTVVGKAVIQHLYLGRNPPTFTDIRVLHQSADDDHLVLELGVNFLSAEDMSAILAMQGFGITANMHVTGMHVEGKVHLGVKFLKHWPFVGRVRVCFVEPPYFQMTVKPIFNRGLDVTTFPGISGWLDNLLNVAFGETLIEPNMLVIDVENFASVATEDWFSVDEKPPIAYVKLEIIEGADLKPSDLNGLSDPYLKGQLGHSRFQTEIKWKTLNPRWIEEVKIPIRSWEAPNMLTLQVLDKDRMYDDKLGVCSLNIDNLRGGERHDKWLSLRNIKMGRIHIAVTVLEVDLEKVKDSNKEISEGIETETKRSSFLDKNASLEAYQKMTDEFERINIKGQDKIGVWIHHPGSCVSQTWESRKGRVQYMKTQADETIDRNENNNDENTYGSKYARLGKVQRRLGKFVSVFHSSTKESPRESSNRHIPTPRPNLGPVGEKQTSIKLIVDEAIAGHSGEG